MGSSMSITVEGIAMAPSASIYAARYQDVANNVWYNWDSGIWSGGGQYVKCKNGGQLYLACAFKNNGGAGNMTVRILVGGAEAKSYTGYVPAGGTIGLEVTVTMPETGNLTTKFECTP